MTIRAIKMVLCVRTDLRMGIGKQCTQCAHGAVACVLSIATGRDRIKSLWLQEWLEEGSAKIVVRVESEKDLEDLADAAMKADLPHYTVHDAGRTEVAAGSATVVCIGPGPAQTVNTVTGKLKLL